MTTEQNRIQELAQRTARAIYADFLTGTVRKYAESRETGSARRWPEWRRTIAGALVQVVFRGATKPAQIYGLNSAERRVVEAILSGLEGNDEFKRLVCAGILELLIAEERGDLLPHADAGTQPSERTVTMEISDLQAALRTANQVF